MERMINRTFYRRVRLLNGRSETVTTRFEIDEATGLLIEHVTMQTSVARNCRASRRTPPQHPAEKCEWSSGERESTGPSCQVCYAGWGAACV
jgi:hypothetical protein